jgi:heme exporter protein CcmD
MSSSGMDINQILAMGGYGIYVWSAYAITLMVFGINLVASFREHRRVKKTIRHYLASVNKSS